MSTKTTLIFALVSLFPALTWAYTFRWSLQTAAPFDFVVLGVLAACTFRLLGPESRRTHEAEMLIYISFLMASFVLGGFILERFNFDTGYLGLQPALLALVGALYPKKFVYRLLVLGPVIIVAGNLSHSILTADLSPERYAEAEGCILLDF